MSAKSVEIRERGSDQAYYESELLQQYHEQGFAGPIKLINEELASEAGRAYLLAVDNSSKFTGLKKILRRRIGFWFFHNSLDFLFATRNRHLDLDPALSISRSQKLYQVSNLLLGQEPVLWRSQFFPMLGQPGPIHNLHRDDYHGLVENPALQMSCQIALSDTRKKNCMVFIPGTHKMDDSRVATLFGLKKQYISVHDPYGTTRFDQTAPIPETSVFRADMRAGEAYFFHPGLIHGSYYGSESDAGPDFVVERRLALALRIADINNRVLPKSFAQTLPRRDYEISLGPGS